MEERIQNYIFYFGRKNLVLINFAILFAYILISGFIQIILFSINLPGKKNNI